MFLKALFVLLGITCCLGSAELRIPKPTNATLTPDFAGSNPPEVHLKHHELSAKAGQIMGKKDSAGELVTTSSAKRPQIKVSRHEQLIQQADKIVHNPEGTLNTTTAEQAEQEEVQDKQIYTCEQSADIQEISFEQNLIHIQGVQKRRLFKNCHLHFAGGDAGSNWYENRALPQVTRDQHSTNGRGTHYCNCLYNVYDFYERKVGISLDGKITPLEKEWRIVQKDYEERREEFPEKVKEHLSLKTVEDESKDTWSLLPAIPDNLELACELKERVCTSGPMSIVVDGQTITRPCIQWKTTYVCYNDQANTCAQYQKRPECHQTGSKCIQEAFGKCLKFQQTYECATYKRHPKKLAIKGGTPCLDGKCLEQMEWQKNQDFGEVMSKLSVFSQMQKDMNAQTGHVFSGTLHRCNRECVGFKDCCKRFGGWGVDIGLSACSAEERLLAELRSKRRCHFVGSFCAEKIAGICIRKKLSFCCFGSVLARLIQEQGRAQLGIGWGEAKNPNCSPFTIEQLTHIQFDKVDLSEITADLVGKMSVPDTQKITQRFAEDWKERLPAVGDLPSSSSNAPLKDDPENKNIMKDTLQARQKAIQEKPGEYTLHQKGKKEETHAELVF